MKPCNHCSYLLFFIMLIAYSSHADEGLTELTDGLKAGEWKGICTNESGNRRYKVKYQVSYTIEDSKQLLHIEMVNLDLDPRPDFTYQLTDIDVKDDTLSFKIPRKHDTRSCTLTKQEGDSYKGICHSDKAEDNKNSLISMQLPTEEI